MMRSDRLRSKRNNNPKDEEIEFYLSEALGIGVITIFLFLAIALFSYHPHDTGIFYFESDLYFIRNWAGAVGALFSSVLFHLLGAGAYFLLGSLAVLAYVFLLGYRYGRTWLSVFLLPVCVFAASLVSALYDIDFVHGLPGGMVGDLACAFLTKYIGFYGTALFAWALLWVSCVVVLRMSIIRGIVILSKRLAASRTAFFF